MRPAQKEWFEAKLKRIDAPHQPGLLFLWKGDRVVFVGRSSYGLFAYDHAEHLHGKAPDICPKDFDGASFMSVPEEVLDAVAIAFIREMRPKYNRNHYGGETTEWDRDLLGVYGFPVDRAA